MATFGFSAGTFVKLAPSLYRVDLNQGFSASRFATAADKLVFEVFYCIMTPLGSIPTDPTFGTLIPSAIGRYSVNSESELQAFVLGELQRAQAGIVARQANQGLPRDQMLQKLVAEAIEIDVLTSQVNIILGITDLIGQSIGFSVPFVLGA